MKQQNSRMVVEVNKLIANALIANGGVYLPNIGSISIETTTPESEGGAPIRDIAVREGEHFKSLTTVITERGNCTPQQAEQVYKRWHDTVVEGDTTTIFGIGEIKDGKFTCTTQMYNKLNPVQAAKANAAAAEAKAVEQTPEPVAAPEPTPAPTPAPKPEPQKAKAAPAPKSKPMQKPTQKKKESKRGGYAWAFVAAIALAVGVTAYILSSEPTQQEPQMVAQQSRAIQTKEPAQALVEVKEERAEKAEVKKAEEPKLVTPKPAAKPAPTKSVATKKNSVVEAALREMESTPRYKVVYGVFSSPDNCGRAITALKNSALGKGLDVSVYDYSKGRYLITIFESNNASECETFRRSDRGEKISNDLWVYERE